MEPVAIRAKGSWRYVVLLQISVLAGFLLFALSSTAEASPLTSPAGTTYTSTIKAEAENPTILHNAVGTLSCKASTIEGKVESHSATTAGGKVSSLTFGECTGGTVSVLKPGSLELHVNSGGTGTLTSSGAEITVEMSGVSCLYTTSSTHLGTLTDSSLTGGSATLDIEAEIPRTGHSIFCNEWGNLTGSYTVTTPTTLYLDSPSPLTSPAGSHYTSTIKAEAESPAILHNALGTLSCKGSTIEGKVESHSTTKAGGKVSSLTFGECSGGTVKVLKPGSLELHTSAGGTGTLTSSGAEITIEMLGVSCLYTTSSTHLGTVTDSSLTGSNATLDIAGAGIPRTGHSFFCGSFGELTGSYKITTPSTLYLDAPSPLTSPAGTYYTSTIKAEAENPTILHNAVGTMSCKASAIEGKVESHTTTTASGKVSSLTFGECSGGTVKVLKPGSLELHVNSGGTGTLTSSGAEITTEQFGVSCLYTTSNTHLGTVTDSSLTGGNATLDIPGALIPRTGHSVFCGEKWGNLTGSYKVTTPSTLYLD